MTAEMTSTIGKLSQALCGMRPSIYIAGTAAKGGEISLNGFGKFKVKDQPAREGRNPSTGALI
jgi:hypothetical protein